MLRNNCSLSFIITLHRSKEGYQTDHSPKPVLARNTNNPARHSQILIWESDTVQMGKQICVLGYADLF